MRLSLEEKEERLLKKKKEAEKKKIRLLQEESKIKRQERKIRTQRLIQRGGLVDKAGLEQLNNNTFLGALLELKKLAEDPEVIKRWKDLGDAEFKKEEKKKKKLSTKTGCLFIRFEKEPEMEVKNLLREKKFTWCNIRKEWRGFAKESEIQKEFPDAIIQKNPESV